MLGLPPPDVPFVPPMSRASRPVSTLTKKDIALRVAAQTGTSVAQSERWVSATLHALREAMASAAPEVRIELRDFGVFEVRTTPARIQARNPRTGEPLSIPPRRKAQFRAGKALREALHAPLPREETAGR